MGNWLFPDKLTPVQKSIRIICIVLLLTCVQPLIFFYFNPFQYSLLVISVLKMVIVVLLWLGKKTGWVGCVILLTVGILNHVFTLFTTLGRAYRMEEILLMAFYFLGYIGLLIYMCLPKVRDTFGIPKRGVVYSILGGILLMGAIAGYILYALSEVF